ncbi:TetR/AcrR family transcriptional regulator [Maridesulfovibrio frigidus]|uniref:TetR/AcrR family transcriptional regulator n=1 Tax=Maridesulfovibrio frigidus TaxID=340956 RepID=UPI0004E20F60|nr:TetR/AcrR family transcriptional regulator [Maridesulfovibrio frigidus]
MVKAKTGRPRSEKSREAIINATHDLLAEKGVAGVTIEAIAKRAGVGKPTIYRWWATSADIVLEAVLSQAETSIPVPTCDSLGEALRQFLRQSMQSIADGGGAHLRFLMAQAQKDEGFRERFRANFVAKRRAALVSIFLEAVEDGQIGSDHNLEMVVDMIFGAMWYRLLIGHAPMDKSFADELTQIILGVVQDKAKF